MFSVFGLASAASAQQPAAGVPAQVFSPVAVALAPVVQRRPIVRSHVGDPIPPSAHAVRPYHRDWSTGRGDRPAREALGSSRSTEPMSTPHAPDGPAVGDVAILTIAAKTDCEE